MRMKKVKGKKRGAKRNQEIKKQGKTQSEQDEKNNKEMRGEEKNKNTPGLKETTVGKVFSSATRSRQDAMTLLLSV